MEDADGSVLVLDTGGWYKLCCPTSQLVKPDVLGAIYRIRKTGAPKVEDPRGLALDWKNPEQLAARLGDDRPAVRERATRGLARLGDKSTPTIGPEDSETRRLAATWTAARIEGERARGIVRGALNDRSPRVRQAAAHAAGLWRDRGALSSLVTMVSNEPPSVARAVAEALGRIGDPRALKALSDLSRTDDPILFHSATYAMIEIGDAAETLALASATDLRARRAAWIALDQMPGGAPPLAAIAQALGGDVEEDRKVASWIVGHRPNWGKELAASLRQRLGVERGAERRQQLEEQLAGLAESAPVQEVIGEALGEHATSHEGRTSALKAMARSGLKAVPESWASGIARAAASDDPETVRLAARAARDLGGALAKSKALKTALLAAGGNKKLGDEARLEAIAAAPGELGPDVYGFLVEQLSPDRPAGSRSLAADALGRAALNDEQRAGLLGPIARGGPIEVGRLLSAFAKPKTTELGPKLVAALEASPARSSLRPDELKAVLSPYGPEALKAAEKMLARTDADSAERSAKLEQMLANLPEGNVRRGQAVFNGTKGACSACHAIGYLGGKVGPDLTKIGQVRVERDLLEAIVWPSASFVRSYEPMVVVTTDGEVLSGTVREDRPDVLVLATGVNQEARVPKAKIEESKPGTVSVMPAGLDQQLTVQELSDLVAFLRASR